MPDDLPKKSLREWREGRFWTQDDLAKRIGVNLHSISDWELGNTEPRFSNIHKLAETLGIAPEQIIFPATGKEAPAA